jgi:signal transduction histidine kinase/putative methionine-R-sulfoxide reductase with GAF domain
MEKLFGRDLASALDFAAQAAVTRDGVDAAHAAFRSLSEIVGADLYLSVYYQAIDRLWLVAQSGYPETLDGIPLGEGVVGRALRTGATQLVVDVEADEDLIVDVEGIEVEVVVPIDEFVVNFEFTRAVDDIQLEPFESFAETVVRRMTSRLESDPRQFSDGHAVVTMAGLNNPVLIAEYSARLAGQGFGLNIVQCVVAVAGDSPVAAVWRQPGSESAQTVSTDEIFEMLAKFEGLTVGTTATPPQFGWGEYERLLVVPFMSDGVLIGGVVGAGRNVAVTPASMAHLSMLASQAAVCIARVRHEQEMRRSLDARMSFMAAVSHELRTPLTAMIGFADLLSDHDRLSSADRSEFVGAIRGNAEHLLGLINDLLDVAQAESGALALGDLVDCDLDAIVHESIGYVSPAASERGTDIVYSHTDATVRSHVTRLKQIIINLLSNAIKFTDEGKIHVTVETGSKITRVVVADSGCGIEADVLRRLFQPFERGASHNDRAGTGLGLVISRRLAEAMGGSLDLYSDGLGFGTRAVLTLPTSV